MSQEKRNNVNCCVVGCNSNRKNSPGTEFYCFPTQNKVYPHKSERRKQWLNAVRRIDDNGSPWVPTKKSGICSKHFVGNKKSEHPLNPSYNPTIFPEVYKRRKLNETSSIQRFERTLKRQKQSNSVVNLKAATELPIHDDVINNDSQIDEVQNTCKETQVDFLDAEGESEHLIFLCHQFSSTSISHAGTQIVSPSAKKHFKVLPKRTKDACCGNTRTYEDKSVGLENCDINFDSNSKFNGMCSLKKKGDREMLDLAGVTHKTFQLLLQILSTNKIDGIKISQEDRLLIFLMKMKCALTFSAIGVLFNIHRTTVSRIFQQTVQYMAGACKKMVFWPNKDTVQATMPETFKPLYETCRAIIDCTEFQVEQPSTVELRVQFYSHYKKGFRLKILVACTPSGFISFVSKCFGGRTTDAQITTSSGFLNLLEPGDLILADKGFPQIKTMLHDSGRGVLFVMPPFLHNNSFTAEEVDATYSIASVRIHVERIMQRIRTFKILDKFTIDMLPFSDDIIFMSCVLVNLQPPII